MNVLLLGLTPRGRLFWGELDLTEIAAGTHEMAQRCLARERPDLLVVSDQPWAWDVVRSISPADRPPVVVLGAHMNHIAPLADEWIIHPGEARHRLDVALERARMRRRIARRALRDTLTDLPNRRAAISIMLRARAYAEKTGAPFSLMLLDLDDFKRINDTEGHDAGDRALRRVGAILRGCAPGGGDCCARIGGDEFALVLHAPEAEVRALGMKIAGELTRSHLRATVAAGEWIPGEKLRTFYRRVDAKLRSQKERHRI